MGIQVVPIVSPTRPVCSKLFRENVLGKSAKPELRKVHDYFKAGVTRVWVVYPEQAEVYIYSTPQQVQVVGVGQKLDGGDLLPGFRLPVAVLFEDEPE